LKWDTTKCWGPHRTGTWRSSEAGRLRLKCDGTRAETRFRLSAKRTSPFKSAEASVQSTAGSRGVRISGSSAGYTMFRGGVKSTGYPLHSPVSPLLPPPRASPCSITFQLDFTGLQNDVLNSTLGGNRNARIFEKFSNNPKDLDPLKGDRKQIQYWGLTNIRGHGKTFCRHGYLATGIGAPSTGRVTLYWVRPLTVKEFCADFESWI